MSENLENIRQKIDALDDKIHDLLMERADLIMDVSAEKKKTGAQIVQPAREARMIRRLLGRHRAPLPEATIVRIWRELVGSVSLLQTGLKVGVTQPEDVPVSFWDMAKNYFGSVLPMNKHASSNALVGALREDDVSFAVVPWPHDGEASPWWPFLLNQDQGNNPIRIVCALPYGDHVTQNGNNDYRALILSKIEFLSSGEDHSFLILELDQNISRTRILDVLQSLKFNPVSLNTISLADGSADSMHLIEVDEFVSLDDERFKALENKFEDGYKRGVVAGGYPVTPQFKMQIGRENGASNHATVTAPKQSASAS